MRFEEFCLRIPDGEFRMRFHERLTVVAGIGSIERDELLDSVLGALTGSLADTRFTYVDELGQVVAVEQGENGTTFGYPATGGPAKALLEELDIDLPELRKLLRVDGTDLGVRPGADQSDGHPELRDARATLAAITEELQTALAARQTAEVMREELADIEERIRRAEEGKARRAYARVLAELERVRAEASALRGGSQSTTTDRMLIERSDGIRVLSKRWHDAADRLLVASDAFGNREPLDDDTLAQTIAMPDIVPADLDHLAERYTQAAEERKALLDRLQAVAAETLPEPSHPLVAELARIDQDRLWVANRRVREAGGAVELATMALTASVGPEEMERLVQALESAHSDYTIAESEVESLRKKGLIGSVGAGAIGIGMLPFLPIVAPVALGGAAAAAAWGVLRPKRRLAEAEKREQEALDRLGVPTYLSFHMRRLDIMVDPLARDRVEQAMLEHRLAEIQWRELAGDISVDDAAALEDETRSYTDAMSAVEGVADELNRLNRRLREIVEPQLEEARTALVAAGRPYGIDDADLAAELIRLQVELGRTARLQQELIDAQVTAREAERALTEGLMNVGFADGDLASRLGAFEWALARAAERVEARKAARSLEEIDHDLRRLEADAEKLRRPEWSNVSPAEADEPELDDLKARRESLAGSYQAANTIVPDVERLNDRHRAVSRRVDVLEAELRQQGVLDTGPADQVQQFLLARLAAARRGPGGVSLPVVLDDPLRLVDSERKYELLELTTRLAERVQLIYLTDDPDVALWARRQAGTGSLTLLEPAAEETAAA